MGAYENPNVNVGVDTKSGLLEAQGIQGFAQGIAKGISAYGTAMAKQKVLDDKRKEANRISTAAYNESALNKTDDVVDKINTNPQDPITNTGLATDVKAFAQDTVVKNMKISDTSPGTVEGDLAKKNNLKFEQSLIKLGDNTVGLDQLTQVVLSGDYDFENSNPALLQFASDKNIGISSDFGQDKNGNFYATMSYKSPTLGAINNVMFGGRGSDTIKINLLDLGPKSTNEYVFGYPESPSGMYATRAYPLNSSITEHVKAAPISGNTQSASNQTVIKGKNNETYSRTYQGAEQLVIGAETFAKGEAAALLSQYSGNLPANAYYNKLKESGTILQKPDGSMYMMVPGSINKKTKVKTFHLTDEQLRNSNGDFKNAPEDFIKMDVPKILIDPTGKDNKRLGLNLYTQEGFNGLVNVIKYQTLKERGWTDTTRSKDPISTISNVDDGGGVGEALAAEIENIQINDTAKMQTLSGFGDGPKLDEYIKTKGDLYVKENISTHVKYLQEKGVDVKTRDQIIKGYKKLIGTKSGDGQEYTQEIVDGFIEDLGDFVLFDGSNNEPFTSYDPLKNSSLLPIIQKKIGGGQAIKDKLIGANIRKKKNDLDVD